jgi:DNA replication protein DnaC
MAHCWQTLYETRKVNELSLSDGLELLLQSEEELSNDPARGIDKSLITRLSLGEYIKNGDSILITGAAGVGKSFLASALGHQACLQGYSVAYYNMQKLMIKLKPICSLLTILDSLPSKDNNNLILWKSSRTVITERLRL